MDEDLVRRMHWLEKKVVELLWLVVSLSSMLIGFGVGKFTATTGLAYWAVVLFTWIWVGLIARRIAFKGVPEHMRWLV